MVLLLRHSDQIIRVRKNSTCECDGQSAQRKGLSTKGLEPTRRGVRDFPAPGLSLFAAGPNHRPTRACSRGEGGFYSQAFPLGCPTGPPPSQARRRFYQPVGRGGVAAVFKPTLQPWLNGKVNPKYVAKINTSMTVCRRRKCRRSITGWSHRRRKAPATKTFC